MRSLEDITADEIKAMNYNQLIGLVEETNRPPGGNATIYRVANRLFVHERTNVLEVGTSTGTTALELSRLTGCMVIGIDTNEQSLEVARRRALALGVERVRFDRVDATAMPYGDEAFDLTFCGNVTSLIHDKKAALSEYRRVTKNGGHIVAVPMYYVKEPPTAMVQQVREAIGAPIGIMYREQAIDLFHGSGLEEYECADYLFDDIDPARVRRYADHILSQSHLNRLTADAFEALTTIYTSNMLLFRDNLSYMGYSICIVRKSRFVEEPTLFTSHPI